MARQEKDQTTDKPCIHGLPKAACDACSPYAQMPRPHRKPFVPPPQDADYQITHAGNFKKVQTRAQRKVEATAKQASQTKHSKRTRARPPRASKQQRQQIEQISGVYPTCIPNFTREKADEFVSRLLAGETFEVALNNGATLRLSPSGRSHGMDTEDTHSGTQSSSNGRKELKVQVDHHPNQEGEPETVASAAERLLGFTPASKCRRFEQPGWSYEGQASVVCPSCAADLHVFRRPYESAGKQYRYWAVVCAGEQVSREINWFDDNSKKALRAWSAQVTAGGPKRPPRPNRLNEPDGNLGIADNSQRPRSRSPWTNEEDEILIAEEALDRSVDQIAKAHQRHPSAIQARLEYLGSNKRS